MVFGAFGRAFAPPFTPIAKAEFLPTDIPGLQLWLKADGTLWQDAARTIPAVADGDVVGCWDDASGNNNHAKQATTANKPLLKLAIQNGRPVIRLDGTNDRLDVAYAAGLNPSAFSLLVVVRSTISPQPYDGIITWSDGVAGPILTFGDDTTRAWLWSGGAVALAEMQPAIQNVWYLYGYTYDGLTGRTYVNTIAKQTLTKVLTWNGNQGLRLGTFYANDASLLMTGDIAEILFYDSVVSISDRQSVEQWLNTRWGIY